MNGHTRSELRVATATAQDFLPPADRLPITDQTQMEGVSVSAVPDPRLVSLLTPHSYEAEQYRSLRLVLEDRHKNAGMKVVAVTSAGMGEGKTTTTINLAGALAQNGACRVLLVDGDLRCSAVASQLGLEDEVRPGLAGAIGHEDLPLASTLHLLPAWNLSVLTAGACPESPYEALLSPRFTRIIDEMREQFDFILIDCPPILAVPDCRLIERCVDGFLLVVSAHQTPRKMLAEALNEITPHKMIGLIFNKDNRPQGYYGRHSRYYTPHHDPRKI